MLKVVLSFFIINVIIFLIYLIIENIINVYWLIVVYNKNRNDS